MTSSSPSKRYYAASAVIALLIIGLVLWSIQIFHIPNIYKIARNNNVFIKYEGHGVIAFAVLLAWYRHFATEKLLWLCQEMHRWISALLMMGAMSAEFIMHAIGIPHVEGWWILPVLSGGACITAFAAWFQQWKKKRSRKK